MTVSRSILVGFMLGLILGVGLILVLVSNQTYVVSAEGSEGSEWINVQYDSNNPARNTPLCIVEKMFNVVKKNCYVTLTSDYGLFGPVFNAIVPSISGALRNEYTGQISLEARAGNVDAFQKGQDRSKAAFLSFGRLKIGAFDLLKPQLILVSVIPDTWVPIQIQKVSLSASGKDPKIARAGDTVTLSIVTDRPLRDAPSVRLMSTNATGTQTFLGDLTINKLSEGSYEESIVLTKDAPRGDVTFELYNVVDVESRALEGMATTTTDGSSVHIR